MPDHQRKAPHAGSTPRGADPATRADVVVTRPQDATPTSWAEAGRTGLDSKEAVSLDKTGLPPLLASLCLGPGTGHCLMIGVQHHQLRPWVLGSGGWISPESPASSRPQTWAHCLWQGRGTPGGLVPSKCLKGEGLCLISLYLSGPSSAPCQPQRLGSWWPTPHQCRVHSKAPWGVESRCSPLVAKIIRAWLSGLLGARVTPHMEGPQGQALAVFLGAGPTLSSWPHSSQGCWPWLALGLPPTPPS